jgi:hypothetical protein
MCNVTLMDYEFFIFKIKISSELSNKYYKHTTHIIMKNESALAFLIDISVL